MQCIKLHTSQSDTWYVLSNRFPRVWWTSRLRPRSLVAPCCWVISKRYGRTSGFFVRGTTTSLRSTSFTEFATKSYNDNNQNAINIFNKRGYVMMTQNCSTEMLYSFHFSLDIILRSSQKFLFLSPEFEHPSPMYGISYYKIQITLT